MNALERGKIVDQELKLTKTKVNLLQQKVAVKDSVILYLVQKDSLKTNIINAQKGAIGNYQAIVKNTEEKFEYKEKIIRRQKVAKWFTLLLGGAAAYFITKH